MKHSWQKSPDSITTTVDMMAFVLNAVLVGSTVHIGNIKPVSSMNAPILSRHFLHGGKLKWREVRHALRWMFISVVVIRQC